jgi:outer membrane immunogenic protein
LSGIKGNGTSNNLSPVFIPFSSTADAQLDWLGTVRARLGYLPTNNLMIYATGGLAYGRVKQSVAYVNQSAGAPADFDGICPAGPGGVCYTGTSSRTAVGWTVGAGLEHALMRNWTVRAEYLYVNLGGNSFNEAIVGGVTPGFPPSMIGVQYNDLTLHIMRAGINYRF